MFGLGIVTAVYGDFALTWQPVPAVSAGGSHLPIGGGSSSLSTTEGEPANHTQQCSGAHRPVGGSHYIGAYLDAQILDDGSRHHSDHEHIRRALEESG
jgi:hypothetical protein